MGQAVTGLATGTQTSALEGTRGTPGVSHPTTQLHQQVKHNVGKVVGFGRVGEQLRRLILVLVAVTAANIWVLRNRGRCTTDQSLNYNLHKALT